VDPICQANFRREVGLVICLKEATKNKKDGGQNIPYMFF